MVEIDGECINSEDTAAEMNKQETGDDISSESSSSLLLPDPPTVLSDFIKSTHDHLRSSLVNGKEFEQVWSEHVSDECVRKQYAQSMRDLAQRHWKVEKGSEEECRVMWCYVTLKKYFSEMIIQAISKDIRIACCELDSPLKDECDVHSFVSDGANGEENDGFNRFPSVEIANQIKAFRQTFLVDNCSNSDHQLSVEQLDSASSLLYGSKRCEPWCEHGSKLLLDVGCCYNPFMLIEDPQLNVIGIDLTPACETVYDVDFVTIGTKECCKCFEDSSSTTTQCNRSKVIECLPEATFDVVTFCLLLSYIPSPEQRLQFCRKARKLLKFNGLLLITETQSVTPHNNSMLMKQWKVEIEEIGFRRVVYECKTHIHAMAFRKIPKWLKRRDMKTTHNRKTSYEPKGFLAINQDVQLDTKTTKGTNVSKRPAVFIPQPAPASKKRRKEGRKTMMNTDK